MDGDQCETSDDSLDALRVDALVDRFSSLVEHAQELAFPPLQKGAAAPADMTGWSKLRELAFIIPSPLMILFTEKTSIASAWPFVAWAILLMAWSLFAGSGFDYVFERPESSPSQAPPAPVILAGSLVLILAVPLALVAYWRWIEFFRDRRYSRIWRLALTMVFVGTVLSSPWWLLRPEYETQFPSLLLQDRTNCILLVFDYLLFVFPLGTFMYMFLLDVLVQVGWFLKVVLKYSWSAHQPFPKDAVRRLVTEPILADEDEKGHWRLVELTKAEIGFLRKWATASREGTDKRLLPTAVLLGVLGVLSDTRAFSNVLDQTLNSVHRSFNMMIGLEKVSPLLLPVRLLALVPFFILGMFFVAVLLLLFRNLVIQSLIIEACIVAEHVCEQRQTEIETEKRGGFWELLLGLLWKR